MWVSEGKWFAANFSFYGNDIDMKVQSHTVGEWMTLDSPVNIVLNILLIISSKLVVLECLKASISL